MRPEFDRSANTEGSALVSVLVLLLGVLVMGYAFFRSTLAGQQSARGSLDEQRAFYVAEAGLHEAFEAIRDSRSGNVASMDAPALLGGGVVWVTATPDGDDRTRLVSTGMVGSGRNALEAVIHMAPDDPPLFVATLNSKETLTNNEGVMIDSFDSELGTYESQAVNPGHGYTYAKAGGDVRSNEDVVLNARATVFGDATPGPGFGVEFNTGAYVAGSIAPAQEPFLFPPIEFPTFTPRGNFAVASGASASLAPGEYDFDAFTIAKNGRLSITGPATLVVDSFAGGKTAALQIDARNGPVTFYVRGAYTHTSGFQANCVTGSPMALAFLINGRQDVTFPSNTRVRGAYYAPNADILFASGNECWGAFAANRIEMANDMRFHFDENLLKHWGGQSGNDGDRLTLLYWRKTAVEPASLVADRRDPLLVLGLEADDLASPGYSWAE